MPTCIATFDVYLHFKIPKDVKAYLMTQEQRDAYIGSEEALSNVQNKVEKVGFWWIKYGTFNYIDENGKEQHIQADGYNDHDYKHPIGDVEWDEDDEDSDDE